MALELDSLSLGLPALRLSSKRKQKDDLTPEEQESLLRRVGGTIGSGLGYVGETLDKPGRALRGLLAGKPGELFNLLPFSDTMGLTDPAESVTGRQLLEKGGFVSPNTPGLDLGDVAGFGAEVVLDPLNLLVGPGKAVTKALSLGKPITRIEKTLKTFGSLNEAKAAGVDVAKDVADKLGHLEMLHEAATTLHGTTAQRLIDATRAANPALANKSDDVVLKLANSVGLPKGAVDESLVRAYRAADKTLAEKGEALTQGLDELLPKQEIERTILENPGVSPSRIIEEIKRGDRGLIGLKLPFSKEPFAILGKGEKAAKFAEKAYYGNPIVPGIRALMDTRVRRAGADRMAQKIADVAYAHTFDELANVNDQMLAIERQMPELKSAYDDLHKAYPEMQPQNFEEAWRNAAETKGYNYMEEQAKQLGAAPDMVSRAANLDSLARQMTALQDEGWKHAISLGMRGNDLDDIIAHTFRGVNPLLHKANPGAFAEIAEFGGRKRRKSPFRGLLTSRLRQASTGENPFAGKYYGKEIPPEELEAAADWLHTKLEVPRNREVPTARGVRKYDQARALASIVMQLPEDVVKTGGLFPRPAAADALNYLHSLTSVRGALMGIHDMTHKFADANAVGPTVEELFKKLDLRGGLQTWAERYAQKHGAKVNPSDLRVPQALADSAARILKFNLKPEEIGPFMKVFDSFTGLLKGSLTVPFPAFHMRNAISGLWQNAVTAFNDPVHAAKAMDAARRALVGRNPELIAQMRMHGLVPEGWLGEEILGRVGGGSSVNPDKLAAEVARDILGGAIGRGVKNFRKGKNFRESFGNVLLGAKNELGERSGGLGTLGRNATNMVEFFNRASHFEARKLAGWSNGMAARSTKLAHFEYSDLGDLEKKVMKRLIPFWTWSRKNLPLQLRQLINNPGSSSGTSGTIRAMTNLRREGGADTATPWLPARLGESSAFMLPGQNPNSRDVKFFAENALTPISEAMNRFPTQEGVPNAKLITENLLAMTHPIVQAPLSAAFNRSFWKHTPASSLYSYPTGNFAADVLWANSPLSRGTALARTLGDERKSGAEKLVNALVGGVRVTDVDLKAEQLRHIRDALASRLEKQPGIGEFTKRYVAQPERVSQKTLEDIEAETAVLKELAALRKEDEQSGRRPARPKAPKPKKKQNQ